MNTYIYSSAQNIQFKIKGLNFSIIINEGNDTLEPKNFQNVDGWPQESGNRWKRSIKAQEVMYIST